MAETVVALILIALTAWVAVREEIPAPDEQQKAPVTHLIPPFPPEPGPGDARPNGHVPSPEESLEPPERGGILSPAEREPRSEPVRFQVGSTKSMRVGAAIDLLPRTVVSPDEDRMIDLTTSHSDPDRLIQSLVIIKPGTETGPMAVARLFAAIVAFGVLLGIGIIGAFRTIGALFHAIIGS
jgi:hypothetical protein